MKVCTRLFAASFAAAGLVLWIFCMTAPDDARAQDAQVKQIQVVFTGGHETDARDHGRPDVLIAAALGVPTEVFREAFSHVTPAGPGRSPEPEEARRNKAALMRVLGAHGVTDERLNAVSNYYRYNRSGGELVWRNTPATAYATVRNGAVEGFTITDAGSGYSSAPQVSIPDMHKLKVTATLSFGVDLSKNGSVKDLAIAEEK